MIVILPYDPCIKTLQMYINSSCHVLVHLNMIDVQDIDLDPFFVLISLYRKETSLKKNEFKNSTIKDSQCK